MTQCSFWELRIQGTKTAFSHHWKEGDSPRRGLKPWSVWGVRVRMVASVTTLLLLLHFLKQKIQKDEKIWDKHYPSVFKRRAMLLRLCSLSSTWNERQRGKKGFNFHTEADYHLIQRKTALCCPFCTLDPAQSSLVWSIRVSVCETRS